MLAPFEEGWKYAPNLRKKISRMIYYPVNENGIWRKKYNNERDVVKVVKIGRLMCLEKSFQNKNWGPCRKLALLHPEENLSLHGLDQSRNI
jgi:hypothetical protein